MSAGKSQIKLFTGNANPELAREVSKILELPLCNMVVSKFANGETRVEIQENCRGCDAFIIQPTCASEDGTNSVNDNLMELHVIASALRCSSAKRITALIPVYGYARQDKKDRSRAAITARLVAKHLEADGVDRVITVDLHASQIQGFFDIPVDNLYGEPLLLDFMRQKHPNIVEDVVIVSPDAGGAKRAIRVATKVGVKYAIISKTRSEANKVEKMDLTGDVNGKVAILIDDMADTCGTLIQAASTLQTYGAKEVFAYVTHGIFSGKAIDLINGCNAIHGVVVTNTIPQSLNLKKCKKLYVVSIAPLLAEAIKRTHSEESISVLFN